MLFLKECKYASLLHAINRADSSIFERYNNK